MTFEEWFETGEPCGVNLMEYARKIWHAATEEVKKDHYRIGEEVEAIGIDGLPAGHVKVQVIARKEGLSVYISDPKRISRIPAWEPKDGEAVLAKSKSGKAFYAVSAGGIDIYDNSGMAVSGILEAYDIKPWKPDCQGKPWDEV